MRLRVALLCITIGVAACSRANLPSIGEQAASGARAAHPNALHFVPFFDFRGGRFGSTSITTGGFGYGGLVGDPAKALFGVTSQGGDFNCGQGGCGVVYSVTQSGSKRTERILHTFTGPDGALPYASLVQDSRGTLYGTTYFGGAFSNGTVFSLRHTKSGYVERVLYSFQGKADGGYPAGPVLLGPGGAIFGTAQYFGANGAGTVFELIPSGSHYTERVIYPFTGGSDGGAPSGGLLAGSGGVIFGTTNSGGVGFGTVFTLTPSSASAFTEQVIYAFKGGSDGRNPTTAVISDGSGSLYGTTPGGGAGDNGTIYKLMPSSSGYSEQVLQEFGTFSDGDEPLAPLVLRDGILYGTTAAGGMQITCDGQFDGCGTLFSLSTSGSGFTVLHTFQGRSDGGLPVSPMLLTSGALYGTTLVGGRAGFGTIYQYTFGP